MKTINIVLILLLFILVTPLPSNKLNIIELYFSKIKLIIKGVGPKYVIGKGFEEIYYPNEIYINGNKQEIVSYNYTLNQTENFVELIWYKNINYAKYIFNQCSDIIEIDLSEFNSSLITNMAYMFTDCISLKLINFSNFDTSKVKIMCDMFRNCSSLTSLDLSNFDTRSVTNMVQLFKDCISLTSLNLSNFVINSGIRELYNMFSGCSSLTSLDISNFGISNVNDVRSMFQDCINLEYINFGNTKGKSFRHVDNFFSNVPANIVLCIPEDNNIVNKLNTQNCYVRDCSDNWKSKQKKMIYQSNNCIESCGSSIQYNYEYNGKCYENCSNGYYYDNETNTKKCKCELEKCLICPPVALNFKLCTKCNDNYYQKENDQLNIGEYINCYKDPKGYYLDLNDLLYKKCFNSCETCIIQGDNINHNCITCNKDFPIEKNFTNYTNCYHICSYYYYFDDENNYICTTNLSCPNDYPKLVKDTMECVKYIYKTNFPEITNNKSIEKENNILTINISNIIYNLFYSKNNQAQTKEEENILYDLILNNIEDSFTSEYYDTTKLDKGEDETILMPKMTITLTTTRNLKNIINNNMTIIYLQECEILLKNYYNISHNEPLYMKKIDVKQENMKIPKVEYDVYYKLNGTNLVRLNLTICKNSTLSLSVPVEINEEIDKLNSSSAYFNDICYSSTSDSGTDIILKDRKTEFIEGNKTVCQDDCEFYEYNHYTKVANCSCQIRESSASFSNMTINKNKLYEKYLDKKIKRIIQI